MQVTFDSTLSSMKIRICEFLWLFVALGFPHPQHHQYHCSIAGSGPRRLLPRTPALLYSVTVARKVPVVAVKGKTWASFLVLLSQKGLELVWNANVSTCAEVFQLEGVMPSESARKLSESLYCAVLDLPQCRCQRQIQADVRPHNNCVTSDLPVGCLQLRDQSIPGHVR